MNALFWCCTTFYAIAKTSRVLIKSICGIGSIGNSICGEGDYIYVPWCLDVTYDCSVGSIDQKNVKTTCLALFLSYLCHLCLGLSCLCCLCHIGSIGSIGNSMWGDGSLYMFNGVLMSSIIARLVQLTRRMSSGFGLLWLTTT